MGRGRTKENRSILAGKRLLIAKEIFGKSYEKLVADRRWECIVAVYSPKTVRNWVHNGIPVTRVAAVAQYFGVTGNDFTDKRIDNACFERDIFLSKALLGNSNSIDTGQLNHKAHQPSESLVTEVKRYAAAWFDQGCPLNNSKHLIQTSRHEPRETHPFEKESNLRVLIFLIVCVLQGGKNWQSWIERNLEIRPPSISLTF